MQSQAAATNRAAPFTAKTSPNSNSVSATNSNSISNFSAYGNNGPMPMNNFGNPKSDGIGGGMVNCGGVGSSSGLSSLGLSSGGGLGNFVIGGSQTGLSSIGMGSGSNTGLASMALGLGGSSTGLSSIGIGSSGLSGSNLGLSNLGLASLAGFGQIGGSSTGLAGMGLTRTGSFGGSRDHMSFTGLRTVGPVGGRPIDPFSRDVPGYPQRGDIPPSYPPRRGDGVPPVPPPRDVSTAGSITAVPPAMSYSAPATPSHSGGGYSDQRGGDTQGNKLQASD